MPSVRMPGRRSFSAFRKGDEHRLVGDIGLSDYLGQALDETTDVAELLDLDDEAEAGPLGMRDRLAQRRDPLAGEARRKPCAGVELLDLGEVRRRDETVPVGGAIEEVVVH